MYLFRGARWGLLLHEENSNLYGERSRLEMDDMLAKEGIGPNAQDQRRA